MDIECTGEGWGLGTYQKGGRREGGVLGAKGLRTNNGPTSW